MGRAEKHSSTAEQRTAPGEVDKAHLGRSSGTCDCNIMDVEVRAGPKIVDWDLLPGVVKPWLDS